MNGSYFTHRGKVRANNEDALLIMDEVVQVEQMSAPAMINCVCDNGLLCIADGMGGHRSGEIASKMALQSISKRWKGWKSPEDIVNSIQEVHLELENYTELHPENKGMGTTIAGLWLNAEHCNVFNVGDSRVYSVQSDGIQQISKDQSLVWQLVEQGVLSKEEARVHPLRNILLECIGGGRSTSSVEVVVKSLEMKEKQTFLLCSDGLYDALSDEEIAACLLDAKANSVECMFEKYMSRGALDNISVIVVDASSEH